jgi:hypothetical protein
MEVMEMGKVIIDVDVDLVARIFSKTLRGLPVEGYGIRRTEVNAKWKNVMH